MYNGKNFTDMENKEAKSEGKELRTAFNSPKFMSVLET